MHTYKRKCWVFILPLINLIFYLCHLSILSALRHHCMPWRQGLVLESWVNLFVFRLVSWSKSTIAGRQFLLNGPIYDFLLDEKYVIVMEVYFLFHFFPCWLKRIIDMEHLFWTGQNGKFSVKALYSTLESESTIPFPASVIWNSWVPSKLGFFRMGGFLGKGANFGSFFFFLINERKID